LYCFHDPALADLPPEQAREMIVEQRGRHFDPVMVDAFLRCYEDMLRIQIRYPNKYTRIFGITESLLAEVCK
jgi:HD-GYP domain-containing protein (c-di-GMP phosphodiesterase class II)